jgi:hypothetical protein
LFASRVVIITKYRRCHVWMLAAIWGTLAVSPINRIDRAMGEVAEKAVRMVSEEDALWKSKLMQTRM